MRLIDYDKLAKINRKGFLICPASKIKICEGYYCSYGERRTEND